MHAISFKIMLGRVRDYLGYIQFPMIAYLFIVQTNFDFWSTTIIVGIGSVFLAILDWKIIFPAEQKKQTLKNPEWNRLMEKIERIEKKVAG